MDSGTQENVQVGKFDVATSMVGGVEKPAYTPASLSRLALADLAVETAHRATMVAVIHEEQCDPATARSSAAATLLDVRDVLDMVERLHEAAVVHARICDVDWPVAGRALGQTRQTLSRNHGAAVETWKAGFLGPDGRPQLSAPATVGTRHPAVSDLRDPDMVADRVDAWLREHASGLYEYGPQDPPLADRLHRLTAEEELDLLLAHAREPLPLAELAAVRERQTVLYERIAAAEPDPQAVPDWLRYAARTRDQAAELRELLAARTGNTDTEREQTS